MNNNKNNYLEDILNKIIESTKLMGINYPITPIHIAFKEGLTLGLLSNMDSELRKDIEDYINE